MKTNTLVALSVIALGSLFATSAQAGWSVGVSLGGPAYYPAPQSCSPPVVYCPPPRPVCSPPVVYCPPPRVVYAPVVYATPRYAWGRYDYNRNDRYGSRSGYRGYGRYDRH